MCKWRDIVGCQDVLSAGLSECMGCASLGGAGRGLVCCAAVRAARGFIYSGPGLVSNVLVQRLCHSATLAQAVVAASCVFLISSRGGRTSGPKLNGSSSPMVRTMYLPSLLNMKMGVSRPRNSRRN